MYKTGIYKITCLINNKSYIGSSININKRWNSHRSELNNNIHKNKKLQNAWNKHGKQNFIFEIVEYCTEEEMLIKEELQIMNYDSYNNGFNLIEKPTKNLLGYKHSDENKIKMKISAVERGRISGVLNREQVNEIRQKFFSGEKIGTLCKQYNVHRKTIRECVYLKTYVDVECKIEGYAEMLQDIKSQREIGKRPRSSGWKHSDQFIEKFRKSVVGPKLSIRKLTDEQIIQIRKEKQNGMTCKKLAEIYSVNQNTISRICRKLIYTEVG